MQFNEVIRYLVTNATVNINQSPTREDSVAKGDTVDNIFTLFKNYNELKRSIDPSYNNDIYMLSPAPNYEEYIKNPKIEESQKIAKLKNILFKELNKMSEYESGRILLNMVGQLIEKEKTDNNKNFFKVDINSSGLNSYDKKSNTLNLSFSKAIPLVHTDGTHRLYMTYPLIHGTIDLKETVTSQKADSATTKIAQNETKTFIESKKGLSPYFITIFHELNHYKDDNYFRSKVKKYVEGNVGQFGAPKSRNSSIVRTMQDFNAPTEHRVVWDADQEDISELTLRMEAKEPLRYLYQDAKYPLYETLDQAIKYSIMSTKQLRNIKFNDSDLEKKNEYYKKLGINLFTGRIPFSTIDATQKIRAYINCLPKIKTIKKLDECSIDYLKKNLYNFFNISQTVNRLPLKRLPPKRKGSF